jgi:hypothetical protein
MPPSRSDSGTHVCDVASCLDQARSSPRSRASIAMITSGVASALPAAGQRHAAATLVRQGAPTVVTRATIARYHGCQHPC